MGISNMSASTGLFDRLPPNIFSVLSGPNARRAWELLNRLATQYFGPESDPPYPDGYLHGDITKEIERFLLDQGWEAEEGQVAGPNLNIQANYLLRRLVDTGWLCEDQVGARFFISMRPAISRFFEVLQHFATDGPQMIGGNIQLVHAQLKSAVANPREQAAGFITAANLCVRLISSLNSTTFRVRDLMQELTREKATNIFVQRFFAEHIAEIYIRDFKELRTENHPLRHRMEILSLVNDLARTEPARSQLLQGYRDLPGTRAGEEEELIERDVERFHRLMTIERFLERMDRIIDVAYQHANAYLGYRLKATERFEAAIAGSITAVIMADRLGKPIEANILSPDPILNEDHLYFPPQRRPKPAPVATRKRVMTPRERAVHQLRKIMIANRDTSVATLKHYITQHLTEGQRLSAGEMCSDSVRDAVAQVALLRLAMIMKNNPRKFRDDALLRNIGFTVEANGAQRAETEFFNLPDFIIKRDKTNAT